MNISLVMVSSDGKSREFSLERLPAVLGRSDECRVRIPLASVSRRHCELSVDSDDELVIKDLKSSNGTYVNGERVRSRELVPGDLIAVGPVVFVVRIDGHPKDVDPLESYAAGAVDAAAGGKDGAGAAIAGVPTWGGSRAKGDTDQPTQVSEHKPAKAKGGDEDDIDSLLADFDFGDDDGDAPKKKR